MNWISQLFSSERRGCARDIKQGHGKSSEASVSKIESLTDVQKIRFQEYREKWIRIGMSTEPADRRSTEQGIEMVYREVGLKPPERFVWLDSPMQGVLEYFKLSNGTGEDMWHRIVNGTWISVDCGIAEIVGDDVRREAWQAVGREVNTSIWNGIWSIVRGSVRAIAVDNGSEVGFCDRTGGLPEQTPWLAFYDYFQDVCGLDICKKLDGIALVAKSCGWWWPLANVCICTERHCQIHVDANHKLHNELGPAIAYPDGWGVYAWHGVRVPKHVIESPETLTVEQVKAESNAEVRRVMMERIGWERFCREARMRVIHEDELHSNFPSIPQSEYVQEGQRFVYGYRPGVERAQLLESEELRDTGGRPLRFVRLTDPSTGREYTIRVRHDHTRCYEAIGASFGVSETEYRTGHYVRQGDVFLKALGSQQIQQHS